MKGAYHFRPCPHCGELMRAGALARHEPTCIKNPAIHARLCEVLTSEDGRHGITGKRYAELSTADKSLPSLNTLIRQSKTTHWDNVLASFRLVPLPHEVYWNHCPRCGKLIAVGKMVEHQESCQQPRPAIKRVPKSNPVVPPPVEQPAETQPVALAIVPPVERATVPLPRITPTASKWKGLKGYDPTWKAPTGDTQWLVLVQPGERTCLGCGDTFAPGGYCMRCNTGEDGTRRSKDDMPASVPTAAYLRPEEYRIEH